MAKKKTTGKATAKKATRKSSIKTADEGGGLCCDCKIGNMVTVMSVAMCQAQGGVCQGASFQCPPGKKKAAAKKK